MEKNTHKKIWFCRRQISIKIVEYLKANGYNILEFNPENLDKFKEDIIASFQGKHTMIQVKGYPSKYCTKEVSEETLKKIRPKSQAKNLYLDAAEWGFINYYFPKSENKYEIALAFPLKDYYREIIEMEKDIFTKQNISITIYFVNEEGEITLDNLNRNHLKITN